MNVRFLSFIKSAVQRVHFGSLALPILLGGAMLSPITAQSVDTLTVAQCRSLAVQNNPLQQKKLYAESIAALQLRNVESNSLPRIAFGAQATFQSDVFGLPIESPLFKVPEVPKDQYKLTVDVGQRIWDGHGDRLQRQQRELERDLAAAQVDVDAFAVRELVTDLFFKALLLQESERVLQSAYEDLAARRRQAEAAVKEGVALRTTVDQIAIQMLKTEQQIALARADKQSILALLELWIGQAADGKQLALPTAAILPATANDRPEYRLFSLQTRSLQIGKDALKVRESPRVEAFAQAGLGRPNPFNFFETGFSPFGLVGLRAQWAPFNWGNHKREAQILDLQSKNIEAQRLAFEQRLNGGSLKDRLDRDKYAAQLATDNKIIALQEDIVRRADAQVKNGVMTSTDYLSQLNLLTQALLTKKTHEIQALQSGEMVKARLAAD